MQAESMRNMRIKPEEVKFLEDFGQTAPPTAFGSSDPSYGTPLPLVMVEPEVVEPKVEVPVEVPVKPMTAPIDTEVPVEPVIE